MPPGVSSVDVVAIGAPGGDGQTSNRGRPVGGAGAEVVGRVSTVGLDSLFVEVGGAGRPGSFSTTPVGGFNGGGSTRPGGQSFGGGGGGASDVRTTSRSVPLEEADTRLLVAAGGGGGGWSVTLCVAGPGGDAGSPGSDSEVNDPEFCGLGTGGGAGTATAGGAGGTGPGGGDRNGTAGALGQGGQGGVGPTGTTPFSHYGGGGGGGRFGGGGGGNGNKGNPGQAYGSGAGGGGGSSLVPPGGTLTTARNADGAPKPPSVTISYRRRPTTVGGTSQPRGATAGATLVDAATVTSADPVAGTPPTGTVVHTLYGPDDATCSGTPAFTSEPQPVEAGQATTALYQGATAGTYRWVDRYSGDATYAPSATTCGDPNHTHGITRSATTTIVSTRPATGTPGTDLIASVTVSNAGTSGFPKGDVDLRLHGTGDVTCTGTPVFTTRVQLGAIGQAEARYPSAPAGSYRWFATYLGDASSAGSSTLCPPAPNHVIAAPTVAPQFTSPPSARFVRGAPGTFVVRTSGVPTPVIAASSVPAWATFTDQGDGTARLEGTPPPTAIGEYPITFTAANGSGGPATQDFKLHVDVPPSFTSGSSARFLVGRPGRFDVTTQPGHPTVTSLAVSGQLPDGVTFTDDGDGTGTFTGTATSAGTAQLTITATARGGTAPPATQAFTLTVLGAPSFTSAGAATFRVGRADSFAVTTTGSPPARLSTTGSLPAGVTFTDGGDGTATLAGTPAGSTGGTYALTLRATNDVDPDATQAFTLTVEAAPAVTTQPTPQTVAAGAQASFTAAASGTPAPRVQWQRAGAGSSTFTDISGAMSPTYSFTPAAGDNGSNYRAVFTNTIGSATTAAAALQVTVPPSITSAASATIRVGRADSFSVTASGQPDPTVTTVGGLPAGVTFAPGKRVGSLAGTPQAGSGGTYALTMRASNGAGPDATQAFTLTVEEAPAVTTQPVDRTVPAGGQASFTAAASGTPAPTVQWQRAAAGTANFANISGATSPTYSFTTAAGDDGARFRAVFTNVAGTATTNASTLDVTTAPAITSAAAATFRVGRAQTFDVVASGQPAPAISQAGALPAGVSFADLGGGRTRLSGTPEAGSGGSYALTMKASNGAGPDATQAFTLTVEEAPTVATQPVDRTVAAGAEASFTAAASGTPAPSVQWQRSTDGGTTFTDISGATSSTYAFETVAGDDGSRYRAVFTNDAGTATTSAATVSVTTGPVITSAAAATFDAGTAESFDVVASGQPAPALAVRGALPQGVTFSDAGGGRATLSGTAAAGTGGTYPLTITATNGSGTTEQAFALTVDEAPAFTSAASTTAEVGVPTRFTVRASGHPTPTLTETGALPAGMTFVDEGDGTATLSGTPADGSAGDYRLVLTATNGDAPTSSADARAAAAARSAEQVFTLTVVPADQAGVVEPTPTPTATPEAPTTERRRNGLAVTGGDSGRLVLLGAAALLGGLLLVGLGRRRRRHP